MMKPFELAQHGSVFHPSNFNADHRILGNRRAAKFGRQDSAFEPVVSLKQAKQQSTGIKDDESLLCHTPPGAEAAAADNKHLTVMQPIQVTFNLN